ncbi:agamous-like MADS-box protein AGL61 [Mangifera indica]|uniref:agamous-like MADS-box protein AGL61 n=1 Tax=Mangifera indica TaxID=29780 RepID=UPI001CFB7DA2|nr:agamous-like MADS-box protein AGL61 [Mangifera indica]
MATKKTRGRQKIEMKRIEKEEDRLIIFSKRRSDIYKKTSKLVTLTGAEIGILVFSPLGKAFSFGHPFFEVMATHFVGMQTLGCDTIHPLLEAHREARINELSQLHEDLPNQLETKKERGKLLKQMTNGTKTMGWWETPTDQLNVEEFQQMYVSLDKLQQSLQNEIFIKTGGDLGASSSTMVPPLNPNQITNLFPTNNINEADQSCSSFPQSCDSLLSNQF